MILIYTMTNIFHSHRSRANHSSASALKIRQRNREQIRNWVTQKMKELRIYKDALSEIDAAWIKFKETELQYFDDIEDVLGPSFQAIDKAFINLKGLLRKVDHMIEELCQDYPQGVSHNLLLSHKVELPMPKRDVLD